MGRSREQRGSGQEAEEAEVWGPGRLPDWLTYHGVTDRTTFDLVRVASARGDVMSVDEQRALTREIARRDASTDVLRDGIQTWMRTMAASPHQPVRLEVASSLDLTMSGTPLKEISGQIGLLLAGDEDNFVRNHIERFIRFAGNDEARDDWPELRDWIPATEVVGIIGRMFQRGPETWDDPETWDARAAMIYIVGGAARTLRGFGILDHFLMEVVRPLLDGSVEDEGGLYSLAWELCDFAEHLDDETLLEIVPVLEAHSDAEVRQALKESRELHRDKWSAVRERVAARSQPTSTEPSDPKRASKRGPVDVRTADTECDDLPSDIEPGQELRGYCLRGANLAGQKLVGCDFTGVDLSGADLRGANLTGAVLYRAVLVGAQLDRADLSNAILSGAVLRNASLFAADVVAASCIGTDLRGANLTAARFRGANLEGADLRGVLMDGTDVYCARIIGAKFDGIGPEGCI